MDLQKCTEKNVNNRVPSDPRELGKLREKGKWCFSQGKIWNNVRNTHNWEKTGIILGLVKHGSAANDKTKNTGFHMADVLPKLIG